MICKVTLVMSTMCLILELFHNSRLLDELNERNFGKEGLNPELLSNCINHYTTQSAVLVVNFKLHLFQAPPALSNPSNISSWTKTS